MSWRRVTCSVGPEDRHDWGRLLLKAEHQERLVHLRGKQAQCVLTLPGQPVSGHNGVVAGLRALRMVATYSRSIAALAVVVPARMAGQPPAGMWQLTFNSCEASPVACGMNHPGYRAASS